MKKVKIWLLATVALLFVVNSSIYGQWNGGEHDLSGTPDGTIYDYYAGTTPQGYLDVGGIVIPPSGSSKTVAPGERFSIGNAGAYFVSPSGKNSFGFFIYFLLCTRSQSCKSTALLLETLQLPKEHL